MTKKFHSLMTTADTYKQTEQSLFKSFVGFGYSEELAKAIAHGFTQYMLGYIPNPAIVPMLENAGADHRLASLIADEFALIRARIQREVATNPGVHNTSARSREPNKATM